MTVMIAEVYDALKGAGVGDDYARRAAEAVAEWKDETHALRTDLNEHRAEFRAEIGALRAEMTVNGQNTVLRWMFGALVLLNTGILVRLLFP
ncbi:MAG TPA: hypothetical protein VHG92_11265 [Afifellaceae bacterium]|nr:hypothetical protein [Afifellaceae bacterium]